MVSGALFLVLLLRSLARGRFGDMLVNLIAHWRHITIEDALVIYDQIIRPNISNIILIVIIVFLLLFFYFSLSWFSKYFDAIAQGVNALAEESQGPITLCPELGFMADQLNQIKDVLAQRAVEAQAAEQRKNDLVVYLAHDLDVYKRQAP